MTAGHCVDDEDVWIGAERGHSLPGAYETGYATRVLFVDPGADLALLQVEHGPRAHPVMPLGTWPRVADPVVIVGNPAGAYEDTITWGHVSFSPRWIEGYAWVQVDASAYYGNSGGGLFNERLELIGVASHGLVPSHIFFVGPDLIRLVVDRAPRL